MSCANCGDNENKPCGCPDTDCHQVKSSELGELQTVYGKDENGCPKYELPENLICRELAGAAVGPAAVPGQTSIIDPDTCQKRLLPALPNAAQVTTDDTLEVVNVGTPTSPVWQLKAVVCNILAKITGGAVVLPYGSTKTLVGDDCQRYRLPSAPAFDSPDGTVQVTQGGTGIAPLYSLVINACAVLAKITGNPVKLPYGGGVLVGKDCQLYQLPDLPTIQSVDQSVTVVQSGTATSPVFNLAVNICKALLGVTDAGNVAAWGNKVLVRNPDGSCELKALPTPASETPLTAQDSQTIDFTTSGIDGHNLTGNVKLSAQAGNAATVNADGIYVPQATAPNTCADLESLPNGGTLQAGDKVVVPGANGNPCSMKTVPNPSGDNWGTQVVQHDTTLTGDGTAGNPLHVVPCAVVQGVATSTTPIQTGDLMLVKKPDGSCEARPMPAASSVSNDCTLVNNAGVLGVNSAAVIAGSTLDLSSAANPLRAWQLVNGSRAPGDPISAVASANISNPSTCRTARVKVDVDFGYWGMQIQSVQDASIAAGFEINIGTGWKRVSTHEGDEGKDIPGGGNMSDMGQDGTSASFLLSIPAGTSVSVQARVVSATPSTVTVYYAEIPIISWFGLAI